MTIAERPPTGGPLTRRDALTALAGIGAGLVAVACGASTATGSTASPASTSVGSTSATKGSPSTAGASSTGTGATSAGCLLMPEATEGPYFIDGDLVRRDITERRPGAPLALDLTLVDADTCAPIRDATFDIWHCDAGGIYSGFVAASTTSNGGPGPAGPGGPGGPGGGAPGVPGGGPGGSSGPTDSSRFLRGIQHSDAAGLATFDTIYPGWYTGRTVHSHVKAIVDGQVHTGQIFFDDRVTDGVHQRSPYAARGSRTTRNADDSIFAGSPDTIVAVAPAGDGYRGTITLAVRR